MEAHLVMFMDDGERREFPLTKQRIVVGRTTDCDLRIPLSSVSRRQCEIVLEGNALVLRDLGSSNGTFHNSTRVQEVTLEPGDEIGIGPVVFTVVIDGLPANLAAPHAAGATDKTDEIDVAPADIEGDDSDYVAEAPTVADAPRPAAKSDAKPNVQEELDALVEMDDDGPELLDDIDIEVLEEAPAPPKAAAKPPAKPKDKAATPKAAASKSSDNLDDDDFADLISASMDGDDDDELDPFAALEALAEETAADDDDKHA